MPSNAIVNTHIWNSLSDQQRTTIKALKAILICANEPQIVVTAPAPDAISLDARLTALRKRDFLKIAVGLRDFQMLEELILYQFPLERIANNNYTSSASDKNYVERRLQDALDSAAQTCQHLGT